MELLRVIQAPMLGVTSPEMVAAANNAGALGSLPVGDMGVAQMATAIAKTRALTALPFAVNVFVNDCPPITAALKKSFKIVSQRLEALARELSLTVQLPALEECIPEPLIARIDYLLESGVDILSSTFGMLPLHIIKDAKAKGIYTIGSCTNIREAELLIRSGVDAICLQNICAGGHRATFHSRKERIVASSTNYAKSIIDNWPVPVYYAGGINNLGAAKAVFQTGASGIQIGSSLLCTKESLLTPTEKDKIASTKNTSLMHCFSGRYARGVTNRFSQLFEHKSLVLPYPFQNKLTAPFKKAALQANLLEYTSLWRGAGDYQFSVASTYDVLKPYVEAAEVFTKDLG